MKNKRKQDNEPTDGELFNLFREFCANDSDCNKTVSDARKAFSLVKQDKIYRHENNI